MQKSIILKQIAEYTDAKLIGDENCLISGIASLDKVATGQISFLAKPNYKRYLKDSVASAIILTADHADFFSGNKLIVSNPQLAFAKTSELFQELPVLPSGIHRTAVIGENCQFGEHVTIGANCVIGNQVEIGAGTVIHPGCVLGEGVKIGKNCLLFANVTIYYRVQIGNAVIIHSGAVIGADGFGMVSDTDGSWRKIPQIGSVVIGNQVEIGANTTIDRGALEHTKIGNGVKLDNLIQIAHNVEIGDNTIIAGCTAIAGSAKIGKNCIFGGHVSINGHIAICDGVVLAGTAVVARKIKKPGIYASGVPLLDSQEALKNALRFAQLDELVKRVNELEKRLNESA